MEDFVLRKMIGSIFDRISNLGFDLSLNTLKTVEEIINADKSNVTNSIFILSLTISATILISRYIFRYIKNSQLDINLNKKEKRRLKSIFRLIHRKPIC